MFEIRVMLCSTVYGYGSWSGPPREMTLGTTPRARRIFESQLLPSEKAFKWMMHKRSAGPFSRAFLRISSGRLIMINTRTQHKSLHTRIIPVIIE